MKRFFSSIAASTRAMKGGPSSERFEVAGRPVRCPHCDGEEFMEGRAQLNTAGLTFFKLDWANRSATTLVCAECGRLEWFLAEPEERA